MSPRCSGENGVRGACLTLLFLLALGASPAALASDWEEVRHEEGIRIWQREVAGTSVVQFRGIGMVEAPLLRVLAVIQDLDRHCEWRSNCAVSEFLIQPSLMKPVVGYYRVASPFPLVDDRDLVFEASTRAEPLRARLVMDFAKSSHPKRPPNDEAVRMERLKGRWILEPVALNRTRVTYEILSDPGGYLPTWVVNIASKRLPFENLMGLRMQVGKGGYDTMIDSSRRVLQLLWPSVLGGGLTLP